MHLILQLQGGSFYAQQVSLTRHQLELKRRVTGPLLRYVLSRRPGQPRILLDDAKVAYFQPLANIGQHRGPRGLNQAHKLSQKLPVSADTR
jgi:hypothetical protein